MVPIRGDVDLDGGDRLTKAPVAGPQGERRRGEVHHRDGALRPAEVPELQRAARIALRPERELDGVAVPGMDIRGPHRYCFVTRGAQDCSAGHDLDSISRDGPGPSGITPAVERHLLADIHPRTLYHRADERPAAGDESDRRASRRGTSVSVAVVRRGAPRARMPCSESGRVRGMAADGEIQARGAARPREHGRLGRTGCRVGRAEPEHGTARRIHTGERDACRRSRTCGCGSGY